MPRSANPGNSCGSLVGQACQFECTGTYEAGYKQILNMRFRIGGHRRKMMRMMNIRISNGLVQLTCFKFEVDCCMHGLCLQHELQLLHLKPFLGLQPPLPLYGLRRKAWNFKTCMPRTLNTCSCSRSCRFCKGPCRSDLEKSRSICLRWA